MRKKVCYIIFLVMCSVGCNKRENTIGEKFNYLGEVNETSLTESNSDIENMELYKIKRNSGMIPDAETAFEISYLYAKKIYGEEIDKELPFQITLENGKWWSIRGNVNLGPEGKGGSMHMVIMKETGRVLFVCHSE